MIQSGWGRYPRHDCTVTSFSDQDKLTELLSGEGERIAFGLGRSYGDPALADTVIRTRAFDRMISFDPDTGVLACEAGVSLEDIINVFLPRGWFLPVTPGTRFVSVGGAIAADVHGKNHHTAGCFSDHILSMEIMLPGGTVKICSPTAEAELFRATCGGMGLTGIILAASIKLQKLSGSLISERTIKADNLDHVLALFDEHAGYTYSVAWIDCLAKGASQGRSLLYLGEHAEEGELRPLPGPKLSVPCSLPAFTLNKLSVSAFNSVFYGKVRKPDHTALVPLTPFFYPLDAVRDWNRIYGRRGFLQYQFVIPKAAGAEGMRAILSRIADSGKGSFLAVLKLFGKGNPNPLSFPMEGYTLALDFKAEKSLFPLLDELDAMVLDHHGRLYLAKDARMSPATFAAGYPGLEGFRELRARLGCEGVLESLQSKRLEI